MSSPPKNSSSPRRVKVRGAETQALLGGSNQYRLERKLASYDPALVVAASNALDDVTSPGVLNYNALGQIEYHIDGRVYRHCDVCTLLNIGVYNRAERLECVSRVTVLVLTARHPMLVRSSESALRLVMLLRSDPKWREKVKTGETESFSSIEGREFARSLEAVGPKELEEIV
jgi:hypothetical protein